MRRDAHRVRRIPTLSVQYKVAMKCGGVCTFGIARSEHNQWLIVLLPVRLSLDGLMCFGDLLVWTGETSTPKTTILHRICGKLRRTKVWPMWFWQCKTIPWLYGTVAMQSYTKPTLLVLKLSMPPSIRRLPNSMAFAPPSLPFYKAISICRLKIDSVDRHDSARDGYALPSWHPLTRQRVDCANNCYLPSTLMRHKHLSINMLLLLQLHLMEETHWLPPITNSS